MRALTLAVILTGAGAPTVEHARVLDAVLARATENERRQADWGWWQDTVVTRRDGSGRATRRTQRTYRIEWLEGRPYPALVAVEGRPPPPEHAERERRRRAEFVKRVKRREAATSEERLDLTWEELHRRYEYTVLPGTDGSRHVIEFRPRTSPRPPERNRVERLLNRMTGRVFVDEDLNITRITAGLASPVRYGLGLLARVDELDLDYRQGPVEGVFMPQFLSARGRGTIALVKTERREFEMRFYDFFPRQAAASTPRLDSRRFVRKISPNWVPSKI